MPGTSSQVSMLSLFLSNRLMNSSGVPRSNSAMVAAWDLSLSAACSSAKLEGTRRRTPTRRRFMREPSQDGWTTGRRETVAYLTLESRRSSVQVQQRLLMRSSSFLTTRAKARYGRRRTNPALEVHHDGPAEKTGEGASRGRAGGRRRQSQ